MTAYEIAKEDIALVAMMVAKLLREEYGITEAPKAADYSVSDKIRHNGSTDLSLAVRLGGGLSFDVRQHWWVDHDRDLEALTETATELAENISIVHSQRTEMLELTKLVRNAAVRECSKARRRGLPYRVLSAEPSAAYDSISQGYGINVGVQAYSKAARLQETSFFVDSAEEVVSILASWEEEQSVLARARATLDQAGATGRIDSVVANALREAGHDVPDTLRRLVQSQEWSLDLGERGDDERRFFCLYWKDGTVRAHIKLANGGTWSEGIVRLQASPVSLTGKGGEALCEVLPDSAIGNDVRIRRASGKKGSHATIWCDQDLLNFNADTGELWAA